MPRARNLKPAFFKHEVLAECEPLARLVFAGLWCQADRDGRLEDRPRLIKVECCPYDDCDVEALLNQLAARGFIRRYVVDGQRLIDIPKFAAHQNPHRDEKSRNLPEFPGSSGDAQLSHGTGTEQAPCKHSSSPADSLLLIPDSLPPHPAAGADGVAGQGALFDQGKKLTLADLQERWNALPGVRAARALTDGRKRAFSARAKDTAWLAGVDEALSRVAKSTFCQGGGDKGWTSDLDWFLRPGTVTMILEGKFDDRRAGTNGANGHADGRIHSRRFEGMGANAGIVSGEQL